MEGPHEARELGSDLQCKHHDGHDHLLELEDEAFPVADLVGRVVDRREPAQPDRENHDHQNAREEGRDRKPYHGDEGARVVEPGILPVRRVNSDRKRDEDGHDIGDAHDPKGLGQSLDHDVHDR